MLGFLPTRAYRPGTPGATTFLSPLSGTFNYGWDSFTYPGWSIWLQLSRPRTASELLLYAETSSLIRLNFSTTGLTLSKNHSLKRGDSPGR